MRLGCCKFYFSGFGLKFDGNLLDYCACLIIFSANFLNESTESLLKPDDQTDSTIYYGNCLDYYACSITFSANFLNESTESLLKPDDQTYSTCYSISNCCF